MVNRKTVNHSGFTFTHRNALISNIHEGWYVRTYIGSNEMIENVEQHVVLQSNKNGIIE